MLKSELITYSFTGTGRITDNEEVSIMESLLGVVGLSADDIEDKIYCDQYDTDNERLKIKDIANRFNYRIVTIELVEYDSTLFMDDSGQHYQIIYDDEIEATFEENFEIVRNEFIMNGF